MKIDKTKFRAKSGFFIDKKIKKTQIILGDTYRSKYYIESLMCLSYPNKSKIPHYLISRDGIIYEFISPENSTEFNKNKNAINILFDNANSVSYQDEYVDSFNIVVPNKVKEIKWKGVDLFEEYTSEQYKSCSELITYLCDKFKINKEMLGHNMFDVNSPLFDGIICRSNIDKELYDVNPTFDFKKIKID